MRTIGSPPSHRRPTQQLRHLLSILHPPPPLSCCPVRITVKSSAAVPPSWRRCCLSFRRAAAREMASAAVSSSLSFVHCRRDQRHRRRWSSAAAIFIAGIAGCCPLFAWLLIGAQPLTTAVAAVGTRLPSPAVRPLLQLEFVGSPPWVRGTASLITAAVRQLQPRLLGFEGLQPRTILKLSPLGFVD